MEHLATPQFWVAVVQIIVINILLAGDNAVVIALACRNLPPDQREAGHLLGRGRRHRAARRAHRLRGDAADAAVPEAGRRPALLLWIGIRLIARPRRRGTRSRAATACRGAIKTVIIADFVMSLDNVIGVAGAAKGSLMLLVFGLVVSIPLVVVGSQLILKLDRALPGAHRAGRRAAGLDRRRADRDRPADGAAPGGPAVVDALRLLGDGGDPGRRGGQVAAAPAAAARDSRETA